MDTDQRTILCVDLDGTLVRTDTLIESFVAQVRHDPCAALGALLSVSREKVAFKERLSRNPALAVERLPFHKPLLAYLRDQRQSGRRIALVTASHRGIADAVNSHLGIFDEVIATDEHRNLRGMGKAARLVERFGAGQFAYAGNDRHDLPVWKAAHSALLVGLPTKLRDRVQAPIEADFPITHNRWHALIEELRVYQWVKNLLVFVPLITAAGALFDIRAFLLAGFAFLCFSMLASSVYLFNDLLDLDADRLHEHKRERPFASGMLPLEWGLVTGFGLAAIALVIGLIVSQALAAVLLLYFAISSAYSIFLKTRPLVDVFSLAALYTLRVLAGGVATGYIVSNWLLSFSAFFFLSLAFLKRHVEVTAAGAEATSDTVEIARRGYRTGEEIPLMIMGIASSFASAIVFVLYVETEAVALKYSAASVLWLMAPLFLIWQCRLWLSATRGYVGDDPILYAARDWFSWTVGGAVVIVYLIALFGGIVAS